MAIVERAGGTSNIGEIWSAESPAPLGPWGPAVKVATHAQKDDNNDFYNPMQHPDWDADGGPRHLLRGHVREHLSGNPDPTPRYN